LKRSCQDRETVELEVQRIADQILTNARENAKSIIVEARKSAEMIIEKQRELGRQRAAEQVSSILSKARTEVDAVQATAFTDTRRKASWTILLEKDRMIANVMDEAKARLVDLAKTEKYLPLLVKLIAQGGAVLGGGNIQIVLNERDSALTLRLDKLSKEIETKTGTKTRLELSKEKLSTAGGVAIKTLDGTIVADNTFETILRRREIDLKPKIAKILFK